MWRAAQHKMTCSSFRPDIQGYTSILYSCLCLLIADIKKDIYAARAVFMSCLN